jgi:transposase
MSNTTASSPSVFAGIDVGKANLQLAIRLPDGKFLEQVFANTPPGRGDLVTLCRKHHVQVAIMEATGGLELDVAVDLAEQEIALSVITPAQSRAFAKALNQQAKTDAIDARLLALFGHRLSPPLCVIPSQPQRDLRELAARRRQLIQQLVQEKNRAQQARDARVKNNITAAIAFLEKQLADMDRHIGGLIAADPQLQAAVERLDSVPAIGPATATHLLIACPELGTLNRQEIASLAGLAPFNHDSGSMNGQRRIRGGRESMRTALYMATVAALRFNPVIKSFYTQMVQRGKKKMVALIAAMRKLLIMLNSMIRKNKTWKEFIQIDA